MVLALSLGEFNTTLLLATPFTMTLPVGLADSYASMRLEIGSAFTLLFLLLVVPPMLLLQVVADRWRDEHRRAPRRLRPHLRRWHGRAASDHARLPGRIGDRAARPFGLRQDDDAAPAGRLAMPDRGGRVLFDGRDVTRLPVEKRGIGMVFQGYALFPNRDVAGNIGYGLEVRGVNRADRDRRVAEMLRLTRLEGLAARRVDQLSGGQRQRVALARALAPAPGLLLLDEPFGALDALREALRGELAALLGELGVTAVFVTHDQTEAMALGRSIVVMEGGRVAQSGPPEEVYRRPATRFVGSFLGTLNALGADRFCVAAGSAAGRSGRRAGSHRARLLLRGRSLPRGCSGRGRRRRDHLRVQRSAAVAG